MSDSEHIYKKSEHESCPDCGGELKLLTGSGASAEGFGSRRAERLVYCPSCSPQNILDKVSNKIDEIWEELSN